MPFFISQRNPQPAGSVRNWHPWALLAYGSVLLVLFARTGRMYLWYGHEELFPVVRIQHLCALWSVDGPFHQPWFPDMCFGYGWPFFTFYPPLGYYVGASLHFVFGWGFGASTRGSFYLATALSGLMVYGYVWWRGRQERWPRLAGWALAAATIYTLTPYHLTDLFARGSLAESWAWAAVPGLFWAVEVSRTRRLPGVLLIAPAYAILVLSHNVIALYGTLLVGFYVIATAQRFSWPFHVAAGGALGTLMAAYYWYPAMRSLPLVLAGNVTAMWGGPEILSLHALYLRQHFVETLGSSGSIPGPADHLGVNLGLVILGGCALATFALFRPGLTRRQRDLIALPLGLVAVLVFVMSRYMPWQWAPDLFCYIQFPWRLLLFTSFLGTVALVAASPVVDRWVHPLIVAGAATLIGIPGAYYHLIKTFDAKASDATLTHWYTTQEEERRLFAGCSTRDYKPNTAKRQYTDPQYVATHPVPPDRLTPLRGNLNLRRYEHKGTEYRYEYSATTDTLVRVHVFDFPGWTLTVDEKASASRLTRDQEGLVNLHLPAGDHIARLRYESSHAGKIGLAASYTAWALWSALCLRVGIQRVRRSRSSPPDKLR